MAKPSDNLPRVAIVGRPNVGKSSLFNRLTRRRIAITDAIPGVTRDTIEATVVIDDVSMILVDTGGVVAPTGELDGEVSARSIAEARKADLVILVLDVTDITPEDQSLIEQLRPYLQKTVVVANKVDTEARDNEIWGLYELGFETVIGISAIHNRNVDELAAAIIKRIGGIERPLVVEPDQSSEIRVAIMGQPNVGKSTLLNHLLDEQRAIVSPIAGTTRDVIEGRFAYGRTNFRILDTAGIRRKAKVNDDLEYYSVNRAIATIEDSDVVLLLVDTAKGLTDQDKKIAQLVVDKGRGIILVLSKWDLMGTAKNALDAATDRIRFFFPILSFAPIRAISAHSGFGVQQLLNITRVVYQELCQRCETGPLNAALTRWMERTPPPTSGRSRWKVRYITQVSVNPVAFVVFVNRARGFPSSYISYIQNSIQKERSFSHVPIKMIVRERK